MLTVGKLCLGPSHNGSPIVPPKINESLYSESFYE